MKKVRLSKKDIKELNLVLESKFGLADFLGKKPKATLSFTTKQVIRDKGMVAKGVRDFVKSLKK